MSTLHQFIREIKRTKPAVISFRDTPETEARLIRAASELNLDGKSALLQDICAKFLAQHDRRCIPLTRLERAQRTREIARELRDLWSDGPAGRMVRKTA